MVHRQLLRRTLPFPLLFLQEMEPHSPLLAAFLPQKACLSFRKTGHKHSGEILPLSQFDLLRVVVVAGLEMHDQLYAPLKQTHLKHRTLLSRKHHNRRRGRDRHPSRPERQHKMPLHSTRGQSVQCQRVMLVKNDHVIAVDDDQLQHFACCSLGYLERVRVEAVEHNIIDHLTKIINDDRTQLKGTIKLRNSLSNIINQTVEMPLVRIIHPPVANTQTFPLLLAQIFHIIYTLAHTVLVYRIEMRMHRMSQGLPLKLCLDLAVDVQLEGVRLPVILHINCGIIQMQRKIAKAPGKVLIAGGYGVLQEGNLGLSLAVDRYFYAVSESSQGEGDEVVVGVESPQICKTWQYIFDIKNSKIRQENQENNPFLYNAIKYSLIYAFKHNQTKVRRISVTILQDRGFLSETPSSSQKINKFVKYDKQSSKTGLGSSAAVIVVTVSSILEQTLGQVPKKTINSVSQVANLAAQNKIGSNFDISTAVFASHKYVNLLPKTAFSSSKSLDFSSVQSIDPKIQHLVINCEQLKRGYCCMIDLKKGSNTRKMVSGFIKALNEQSHEIISTFYSKSRDFVERAYGLIVNEPSLKQMKIKLHQINMQYRCFLQKYSAITGVPVQPPEFKHFLDKICSNQQVLYAICPGSGGYDAIFVLSAANTQNEIDSLKQELTLACVQEKLQASIEDTRILWENIRLTQDQIVQIEAFLKKNQ